MKITGFFEEQYSAKTFKRPEFSKAVKKAIYSGATKLLVLDWSRFSRNFTEAIAKVEELKKRGIEVNAMLQWVPYNQPEHLLLLSNFIAMSEIENQYRARNVKRGLSKGRNEGRCTFKAPMGYKNERDSQGRSYARIDPPKAAIIREIFEDFANGISVAQIRHKFAKEGVKKSRSSFYRILKNVFYIGKIKTGVDSKGKNIYVDGLHTAIIELKIFQKVQERLDHEYPKTKPKKYKLENEFFPLRGFLYCPRCQKRLTGSRSQNSKKIITFIIIALVVEKPAIIQIRFMKYYFCS